MNAVSKPIEEYAGYNAVASKLVEDLGREYVKSVRQGGCDKRSDEIGEAATYIRECEEALTVAIEEGNALLGRAS